MGVMCQGHWQGRDLAEKADTNHGGWVREDIVNIRFLGKKVSGACGDTVFFSSV